MMGQNFLTSLSKRKWKELIQFPFSNIKLVQQRLFELENEKEELKKTASILIDEWRTTFPIGSVPVYLTRVSDKSYSTLRWRLSASHSQKASPIQFSETLLDYFHRDEQRNLVLIFESRRLDIDHKLSMVLYEILRLSNYLEKVNTLSSLKEKEQK